MPPPPTIYCIDTSSIIKWYVEEYPPTIFESLPKRIEELIAKGRLRSPKAVFDEIRPGDDCHTWCKAQTDLFVGESVSVRRIVTKIMATHHNKEKPHKGISGGDPFVIAFGKGRRSALDRRRRGASRQRRGPQNPFRVQRRRRDVHRLPADDPRGGLEILKCGVALAAERMTGEAVQCASLTAPYVMRRAP